MGEWFADNWVYVMLLVLYLVERSPEVLRILISRAVAKECGGDKTQDVKEPATADDKKTRSTGRKVASGVLHLLPVVSRVARAIRATREGK